MPDSCCKDPSNFLFSGFVYCYLHNPFSSYTVNIWNVSYYLTIERDLVQVGLMSKDQVLYISGGPILLLRWISFMLRPCADTVVSDCKIVVDVIDGSSGGEESDELAYTASL